MLKCLISAILIAILTGMSFGQEPYNIPFSHSYPHYDQYVYQYGSKFHTSVKPFLQSQTDTIVNLDTLFRIPFKRKIWNIAFNRSLIKFDKWGVKFTIDPVINFEAGKGNDYDDMSWVNTRGFIIRGALGKNFAFGTGFYENQAKYFDLRQGAILTTPRVIIPGQGVAKGYKTNGYDYYFSEAYVSYSALKYFNFQLGTGKHFLGDGYRSLLLSDNSFNYPYFKITTDFWRIKYVNLWAQFQDLYNPLRDVVANPKKWGTFQYLSYNVTDWLSVGLFEAIIWENRDSLGHRGFDFNYANPIIFMRPVEWSLSSPDNVLVGVSGKITLPKRWALYGQFILDEFKIKEILDRNGWAANKWGLQGGLKGFDIFGLKNVDIQTEINMVRPFMYSHVNNMINYTHYRQPLAHPLGSNFVESISFLRYNYKRAFIELGISYSIHGRDTANLNYGNDLFLDYTTAVNEYGNKIGQGEKVQLTTMSATVSYLVNPAYNLNIYAGLQMRNESSALVNKNQNLIVLGIRCSLYNIYWDYRSVR